MLPSTAGTRSPLFALAATAAFVLVFIFGFLAWQSPAKLSFPTTGSTHVEMTINNAAPTSINEIIRQLFAPLKIGPAQPEFAIEDGTKFTLPENPLYTKKLGKEVLVLDLDTRPLASTEDYLKGEYDWRKIGHVSGGVFNHYTYALIHGYDYKLVHAKNFEDRNPTWIKPSALANQLKQGNYKFIVFLDADATFRFLHLPIEWMLNYWKINEKHAITMAKDPWDAKEPQYNSDRFNRTLTNTGFMVVQDTPATQPLLKAWHECPDDTRYQNCSQWKKPKFHEQSAFGDFVRYDFEENIKELECAEANGFPGVEISHCEGKFIRHYWFDKTLIKKDFRENMMQAITLPIQRLFAENTGGVIEEQKENKIVG
ncbi:hypothetical protein P154DRAFT_538830 [Amniculicola lignicola CBS 123094]|uniref:Nucleotide-diphospho-sugar transferase domain-containing protein n=1 Tax=Amniculicola lignicola CBS 123094 TaxID=1392246 RepID=A0A6A5W299_9PLEO|nr:hypothetical protein P154DRAFT_538830 [Amniculicola lignicola CBS 123094]